MKVVGKVVAIIPARGGSKGIPRKNIKMLAGRPLISYPIEVAKNCKLIDRVIVSTEDDEIAGVARRCGAEVIRRPLCLARYNISTLPVLLHVAKQLEKQGYKPDAIVLLYATAPLIKSEHVEEGIKKIVSGADSVVSVSEDTRNYKLWRKIGKSYKPMFKKRINRQLVKRVYRENGAFYVMTYDTLVRKKSITGKKTELVFMQPEESVDIDTHLDFILAEALLKSN
jgi:CMP-N-acetylneuraminic acid synthetase